MLKPFQTLVEKLGQSLGHGPEPAPEALQAIAAQLLSLCEAADFNTGQFPQALPGQEALYELAVSASGGPSAYLVSDGAGVNSPPHGHQTWAVIVGLRGVERNIRYRLVKHGMREVVEVGAVDVGAGACLCLTASDIHATQVVGKQATYHVHLYGRVLSALPAFAERCYVVGQAS